MGSSINTCSKQARHQKAHNADQRRVPCPQCDKVYMTTTSLSRHAREAHERAPNTEKPFPCSYCEKRFWDKSYRKIHLRVHTGERPLACPDPYCKRTFTHSVPYNAHIRGVHQETEAVHGCSEPGCGKRFKTADHLKQHVRTHDKFRSTYPCPTCDKVYKTKTGQTRHVRFDHEGREREHSCTYCNKTFALLAHLTDHLRSHTGERPFKCGHCSKRYAWDGARRTHEAKAHKTGDNNGIPPVSSRDYACQAAGCGKRFNRKAHMISHMLTHTVDRPTYECSSCGRKLLSETGLKEHIKFKHKGQEKRHNCEYCGKKFAKSIHLAGHIRSHTGEKPFECPECPARFAASGNLTKHRKSAHGTETAGNAMQCSWPGCGKLLKNATTLKNHVKVHSVEKSHECPDPGCDKAYKWVSDLTRHLSVQHGKEPRHGCSYCSKKFVTGAELNVHVRVHTGEKPFGCPECGAKFTQKCGRDKHVKNMHGSSSQLFRP